MIAPLLGLAPVIATPGLQTPTPQSTETTAQAAKSPSGGPAPDASATAEKPKAFEDHLAERAPVVEAPPVEVAPEVVTPGELPLATAASESESAPEVLLPEAVPPLPSTPAVEGLRQSLSAGTIAEETEKPTPEAASDTLSEIEIEDPEAQPLVVPPVLPQPIAEVETAPQPEAAAPEIAPHPSLGPATEPAELATPQNAADPLDFSLPASEQAPDLSQPAPSAATASATVTSEVTPKAAAPQPIPSGAEASLPSHTEVTADSKAEPTTAPPNAAPPRVTPPLLRNVLDRLSEVEIAEGKTRLLLRPKGLGVLEIDLSRQMGGRLQLVIRAENPLLLDALRQESGAMSAYLSERGFDLSGGGAELDRWSPPPHESDGEEATAGDGQHGEAAHSTAADHPAAPHSLLDGARLDLVT